MKNKKIIYIGILALSIVIVSVFTYSYIKELPETVKQEVQNIITNEEKIATNVKDDNYNSIRVRPKIMKGLTTKQISENKLKREIKLRCFLSHFCKN